MSEFMCNECEYITDRKQNFRRHLKTKKHLDCECDCDNEKILNEYRCDNCHFVSNDENALIKHKENQCLKVVSISEFKCMTCNKTFKSKFNYTRHINSEIHNTKEYKCKQCDKIYKTNWSLMKHVRNHDLNDPKLDDRIPVKNNITGKRKYTCNAPKRKNIEQWLIKNPDWEIIENYEKSINNIDLIIDKLLNIIEDLNKIKT